MKVYSLQGFALASAVVVLCLGSSVSAQQGTSSASVSRSRAITNSNPQNSGSKPANSSRRNTGSQTSSSSNYDPPAVNLKLPETVMVEEFINYHKHRLPLPKAGQAVALDTRWGNDQISSSQREAVLQIGFTTAEVNDRNDLRPLNLSLVIDRSGSMAEGDKMSKVKESLQMFVGKLRPEDIISIVVFDTNAEVLLPAQSIGNGIEVRRAINCIAPQGSTNLHGGLMLGYKEAAKYFDKDSTNRVILLTDGIANQGVTDPSKIAAESSEYNGQGIDLSTIGVGLNLNNDLLQNLAKSGRGLYQFVSDYQDIQKVFANEVQSLMSRVAKKVEVNVDYDSNLELQKVYGYSPKARATGLTIGLDDMNSGLTQVVMMRFRAKNNMESSSVKVRLSYFDEKRQKMIEEIQTVNLQMSDRKYCPLLADGEVKKNYTIAELSQSLFDMTNSAKSQNYRQAENILNTSISETYKRFPNMEDKDIRHILDIAEGYQRDLRAVNRQRRNEDCGNCN